MPPCDYDRLREKATFAQERLDAWQLRAWEGRDLAKDVASDRTLSKDDMQWLVGFADYLIDRRNADVGRREKAAEALGLIGHKYGLPALFAVIRTKDESLRLRDKCVQELRMIRDKRVVAFLINEVMADYSSGELCGRAHESLLSLVKDHPFSHMDMPNGYPEHLPPPGRDSDLNHEEYRKQYLAWLRTLNQWRYAIWHEWWLEHCKDELKLRRPFLPHPRRKRSDAPT